MTRLSLPILCPATQPCQALGFSSSMTSFPSACVFFSVPVLVTNSMGNESSSTTARRKGSTGVSKVLVSMTKFESRGSSAVPLENLPIETFTSTESTTGSLSVLVARSSGLVSQKDRRPVFAQQICCQFGIALELLHRNSDDFDSLDVKHVTKLW